LGLRLVTKNACHCKLLKKGQGYFDTIGKAAVMNLLDYDKSFMTFERQYAKTIFGLQNNTIVGVAHLYKKTVKPLITVELFSW